MADAERTVVEFTRRRWINTAPRSSNLRKARAGHLNAEARAAFGRWSMRWWCTDCAARAV